MNLNIFILQSGEVSPLYFSFCLISRIIKSVFKETHLSVVVWVSEFMWLPAVNGNDKLGRYNEAHWF